MKNKRELRPDIPSAKLPHHEERGNQKIKETESVSLKLLMQLADESVTSIYVADYDTDELLYMNRTAKEVLRITSEISAGQKCYEYLMRRETPCPFCHKSMFSEKDFRENIIQFPFNGRKYRISSKIILWGERKVHIHYICDVTSLLDKEKELRTLTDFIPTGIGIYYAYPDGRLEAEYLNDGYYKMLETTREKRMEYSGFAIFNAVHPEDLEGLKTELRTSIKENRQMYYEVRIRKEDDSYKWVSIRADIAEKTKEKTTLYCAYSDIDILKKAQQEQAERQQHYEEEIRLKTTVSANVKVLAIADLTQNVVLKNPAINSRLRKFFNQTSINEVILEGCRAFLHPLEQQSYFDHFNRDKLLLDYFRGITHGSFRHQIAGANGWYESSYDLVLNPYTEGVEAILSLRNVTEIVRSEQVINTLMKIDYESIITIDASTGEPFVLEASDLIYGVIEEQKAAKDNVTGVENYLKRYCIDKDLDRVILETSLPYVLKILNHSPLHTTMYSLNIHGKIMRKRAVYAFLDRTRRTMLCARQDVTKAYEQEQKRNEQLEQALHEAEEANRSKADFFAHMSHDMRTPLNGILGSVGLAIECEAHSPQMAEYLHDIQFSGDFLLNLINDILDLSKMEHGAMKLLPQEYTYFEFIENMTKMIEPLCKKKNITLYMNPLKENVAIKVDILRFQQIFFNIFSNAIKYTPEGGTINHYTVVTPADANHIDCKCHIIDNGIGMSKEFQKKLFEPYSREQSQVSIQGTGLGLTIANELAHLMGGELLIKSEPEKGTEVVIHTVLEVIPLPKKKPSSGEEKESSVCRQIKGLRILLCEDHPLNAKIARKLLEKQGALVELAENGEQAVKQFFASSIGYYDLILMDIQMPVMTGLEASKRIRGLSRPDASAVPILAMTANAYEEDIRRSFEAGMDGHLAKPIHPSDLYEKIVELCGIDDCKS